MTAECVVFLVGEGPSDIGDLAVAREHRSTKPADGFMQPVLRKLADGRATLAFRGQTLKSFPAKGLTEPRDALGRKARQALALAALEGATALVLVTDVDKSQGERASAVEAQRRMRAVRGAIESGFATARDLDDELAELPTVVATPLRMIEAWALSDAAAIAEATGQQTPPSLPSGSPEGYWGDEQDPSSNHPKCVLTRACGTRPGRRTYGDIARETPINVLKRRCPTSFAPFAAEVRAALDRCVGPAAPPSARRRKRR